MDNFSQSEVEAPEKLQQVILEKLRGKSPVQIDNPIVVNGLLKALQRQPELRRMVNKSGFEKDFKAEIDNFLAQRKREQVKQGRQRPRDSFILVGQQGKIADGNQVDWWLRLGNYRGYSDELVPEGQCYLTISFDTVELNKLAGKRDEKGYGELKSRLSGRQAVIEEGLANTILGLEGEDLSVWLR